MTQFNATASLPHKGYRLKGKPSPESVVVLTLDFRNWRLTPAEARNLAKLLEDAATKGEQLLKEFQGDAQADWVG